MEIFQTFAEISIGILGFTAIVIAFRPYHQKWNDKMYQGMIAHSVQVLVYSILPFILEAYHCSEQNIWLIGSIVLGVITILQGFAVLILDKDSKLKVRLITFIFSITAATLQAFNIFDQIPEKGPYLLGICWHIFQSLVIFSMIVGKKIENDHLPKP